jgi:hypothetical protein
VRFTASLADGFNENYASVICAQPTVQRGFACHAGA